MSYGVRIWGPNGDLRFDTSTSTWRSVLSLVVSFSGATGKSSQQFSVPGCTPENSVVLLVPIGAVSENDRQLESDIGSGVVTVRNFIDGYAGQMFSRSSMRMIVLRWY